jgi:hypothetical protein
VLPTRFLEFGTNWNQTRFFIARKCLIDGGQGRFCSALHALWDSRGRHLFESESRSKYFGRKVLATTGVVPTDRHCWVAHYRAICAWHRDKAAALSEILQAKRLYDSLHCRRRLWWSVPSRFASWLAPVLCDLKSINFPELFHNIHSVPHRPPLAFSFAQANDSRKELRQVWL